MLSLVNSPCSDLSDFSKIDWSVTFHDLLFFSKTVIYTVLNLSRSWEKTTNNCFLNKLYSEICIMIVRWTNAINLICENVNNKIDHLAQFCKCFITLTIDVFSCKRFLVSSERLLITTDVLVCRPKCAKIQKCSRWRTRFLSTPQF